MTIKVFDLACDAEHGFEGWFASAEAFDQQAGRRLIACPLCGSTQVRKLLSAPRLNLGASAPVGDPEHARMRQAPVSPGSSGPGARPGASGGDRNGMRAGDGPARDAAPPGGRDPVPAPPADGIDPVRFQRLFLAMARKLIESTEDVGERFVEEARKIHYQETPGRAIRGSATRDQAAELREEGIEVFALPIPESLKGPVQ